MPSDAGDPQAAFWDALASHCGNAYEGALVSEDARDADMAGNAMIAHWAQCSDNRIAVAFHIFDGDAHGSWNRSRTWILTRNAGAITLKHDHRHADGTEDELSQYGGDSLTDGSAERQAFPADAYSVALFTRTGRSVSNANVWALGLTETTFTYELARPNRLFRVAFDLTEPLASAAPKP